MLQTVQALAAQFGSTDARRDAERILPYDEIRTLGESGLFTLTVPKAYGGPGLRTRTLGEVFTELTAGDASIGQIPQNHYFFVNVLASAGTPEQQAFFYAEILRGRHFANALSERGSRTARDFDIGFAPQPDGSRILDGTKYYATGSLFAHWIPVYATDEEGRVYAAWVPADEPGVTVEDDWNGMGQRTTGSGTVRFDKVRVPAERIVPVYTIFEKDEVFGAFGQYLHAAIDTGIAVAALRDGKRLVQELARPRKETGLDRAADEEAIIDLFGELALRVRTARALLREAGDAVDAARADLTTRTAAEASAAVAAARAHSDEVSLKVSSGIFELIGTRAADRDLNLHRHWRNARTHTLHDPRRLKLRYLGGWELNDTPPPANGLV
ncbi:SfnB family sulfur acquisition oxidoreductase [Streptomyces endophyticus]|uniref:SfnB family sulfur acquisition oxidoreductase n=1 Tax=Streptomyces endophyticus TaxID=714166 RepID=A0ABU6F5F4_9ACTN|nr:SfnB family sulfur acquisition oxidoreductase [Streptomyces endophyticus]